MKTVNEIKLTKDYEVVKLSWQSPLIGIIVLSFWTYGIIYLYRYYDLIVFIALINLLFIILMSIYLIKEIKSRLNPKKFLIALSSENLIIPTKWVESSQKEYLIIKSNEIDGLFIQSKKLVIPYYFINRTKHRVLNQISLKIKIRVFNNDLNTESKTEERGTKLSFLGSPVSIKDNIVSYNLSKHKLKIKKLISILKFFHAGKMTYMDSAQDIKSIDQIFNMLITSGDVIVAKGYIEYLYRHKKISKDEYDKYNKS